MSIIQYKDHDRLLVAVDCIIFGFDGTRLRALLVKRGFEPGLGKWSLMGGFVNKKESVDEAASRVLHKLTGLNDIYMEQLSCFGDVQRDPGGRVISISFFALIKIDDYSSSMIEEHNAKWFLLDSLPQLVFDHRQMIKLAKERLKDKISGHPVGFALLPHKFTLQQLQSLYEAIYERQLDKRNFTRKIHSLNILHKLKEKEKQSSRRGAFFFVFDKKKYEKLDKEGLKFL